MDLNLKEIFEKDIDRPIDSVIKADDEESILNELEEYVITNEIENHCSLMKVVKSHSEASEI